VKTKTKTIVVDGLSALRGGGQTYLVNLFRYLPQRFSESLRVIAIIPTPGDRFRVNDRLQYIQPSFPSHGLVTRVLWSKTILPKILRRTNADVLFCPAGFVSAFGRGWKTAVTFQNMLPFSDEERNRYPHGYMRARLRLLRHIQSRSFRKADLLVFISQFAKSVIDILVRNRRGQSTVIIHGVNDQFRWPNTQRRDSMLPERYVAYVSIRDVYKAQVEVVQAWALMRRKRRTTEKLVLVGPAYEKYGDRVRRTIGALGMQDEVIVLGDVPHELLPAIYHGAVANIFASSCENCPNILLEALAAGNPVLCSDYPPMPEFADDAALYFDPYRPESLAIQLTRVLDDAGFRQALGERSHERAAHFQWARSAEETWQALSDLAFEPQSC
jgi:glycosyltransferase involved in cell wall biosynthesis